MKKDKRLDLYKEQIEIEKQIIENSQRSLEGVKNEFVKDLISSINFDSHKHKRLMTGLIKKHEGVQAFVPEKLSDGIKDNIKKHIELESEAIKSYKKIIDELKKLDLATDDKKELTVLKAILEDEIRHHALLLRIQEVIVDNETLTSDDLFDMLWEESPSYEGSPLGP